MCALRENPAGDIPNVVMIQQPTPFDGTFYGGPSDQFLRNIEKYFAQQNTPIVPSNGTTVYEATTP